MNALATSNGSGVAPGPAILTLVFRWIAAAALVSELADGSGTDSVDCDDAHCMERLAAGNTNALRPIFDRWKLPLLSYFYRSLGSRTDAEDLTLRVFEQVHRAAHRFRGGARFSTWLFAIARGELLHELRRRRRKPVEPVAPEDLAQISSAVEQAAEIEEHLLAALQQLPERQRSAVLLAAAGDLDHTAIAAMLHVSVNNLNVMLHRARQALRDLFRKVNP